MQTQLTKHNKNTLTWDTKATANTITNRTTTNKTTRKQSFFNNTVMQQLNIKNKQKTIRTNEAAQLT